MSLSLVPNNSQPSLGVPKNSQNTRQPTINNTPPKNVQEAIQILKTEAKKRLFDQQQGLQPQNTTQVPRDFFQGKNLSKLDLTGC